MSPIPTVDTNPSPFFKRTSLANEVGTVLMLGMVVDSWQWSHLYSVQTSLAGVIPCAGLTHSSLSPHGYRDHAIYAPGTQVLVWRPPHQAFGVILGSIPSESLLVPPVESILEGAAASMVDSEAHAAIFRQADLRGFHNFNAGRPKDTFPGEAGLMNSLGLGLDLSATAVALRATDLAGVWAYYLDHLLRVSGHNLQIWSAAREEWSGEDQGEADELQRSSPFPWEMRGLKSPGDFTKQEVQLGDDGQPKRVKGINAAKYQPQQDDQMGIYRLHRFGGYLGDLERIIVSAPSQSQAEVEQYSTSSNHVGLSETVRHANGVLEVRSAKGIFLEKSLYIPVPKQMKLPDDPDGDTTDNYRFAGQGSSGDEHDKSDFKVSDSGDTSKQPSASAVLYDMLSWLHKSYGMTALRLHVKDWHIPEAKDNELARGGVVDTAPLAPAGTKYLSSLPQFTEFTVDQRKQTHRYFRSRSLIAMTDDGSVLIEDGWGGQIEMSRGSVRVSAPNDVVLAPGRNATVLAPNDVVLRAGFCLDATAAQGDVRLKAEHNLHMLGGNSGTGGVLVESRGIGSHSSKQYDNPGTKSQGCGIVFQSPQAPMVSISRGTYIRTVDSAPLVLDADSGAGMVQIFGDSIYELVVSERFTGFGVRPDAGTAPTEFELHTADLVYFGQTSTIYSAAQELAMPNGEAFYINGAVVAQSLQQNTGSSEVGALWAPQTTQYMQQLPGTFATSLQPTLTFVSTLATGAGGPYQDETSMGNDKFITGAGFSFRTDAQYLLTDVVFTETRWQQLYRTLGSGAQAWDEPKVTHTASGQPTMPFPGYDTWTSQPSMQLVTITGWTPQDGEKAVTQAPAPATDTPKKAYLVNYQGRV